MDDGKRYSPFFPNQSVRSSARSLFQNRGWSSKAWNRQKGSDEGNVFKQHIEDGGTRMMQFFVEAEQVLAL
jgi:hypothetical protein